MRQSESWAPHHQHDDALRLALQSPFIQKSQNDSSDPQVHSQQIKFPLAVPPPPKLSPALTWGLPVPKPSVGVVGTDMECGPIGELMTEKGGPMPLMGELRVLIGECSCPGEPRGEPIPGPSEGCSEGAAMEPRPVGELRDEEFTWVEKSARQELARRRVRAVSRTWQLPTPTTQATGNPLCSGSSQGARTSLPYCKS